MIVRIAEIQVDPANLDEYLERARTIGADSVANEPGVIAIFPMQDKRNPGQIRILGKLCKMLDSSHWPLET
ncbi:antibiotic biosynthesis monooxygenase family protein [Parasutterella sp.]|uniref:antibiotic biosynthesis monooxygenase family protein n=1 Tax=Parasutterella sp. TaxID=2049037 RepID=UPI0030773C7D